MVVISSAGFLAHYSALLAASQGKGSVFLTVKQTVSPKSGQPAALYRVTDGKKKTLAAYVEAEDVAAFHAQYSAITRGSMTALKKVKKAKGGKAKEGGEGGK